MPFCVLYDIVYACGALRGDDWAVCALFLLSTVSPHLEALVFATSFSWHSSLACVIDLLPYIRTCVLAHE